MNINIEEILYRYKGNSKYEVLAKHAPEYIEKWFNRDKFNWQHSNMLAEYCSKSFDFWFDETLYNYKHYSWCLPKYCKEYINIWFNNRFNYNYANILSEYCSKDFDIWFDYEKIKNHPYKDVVIYSLLVYCKDNFNDYYKLALPYLKIYDGINKYLILFIKNYKKEVDKWFDDDIIIDEEMKEMLTDYKYPKKIWGSNYLKWKLTHNHNKEEYYEN